MIRSCRTICHTICHATRPTNQNCPFDRAWRILSFDVSFDGANGAFWGETGGMDWFHPAGKGGAWPGEGKLRREEGGTVIEVDQRCIISSHPTIRPDHSEQTLMRSHLWISKTIQRSYSIRHIQPPAPIPSPLTHIQPHRPAPPAPPPKTMPVNAVDFPQLQACLTSNAEWAARTHADEPGFFERSAKGQKPFLLWIGCE